MPNITNPTAIAFCDQKVRPMADLMLQEYNTAKSIVNYWNANSMSSIITNDSSIIEDSAATNGDGRQVITGAMVTNIITRAIEKITDYEASSDAKLNTVEQVSVNGQARF
ncbi:MAG TPA: hypothetical protein VKR58_05760 [Aquella sp.]|nr:hypothetical protein [Aquella sp.]